LAPTSIVREPDVKAIERACDDLQAGVRAPLLAQMYPTIPPFGSWATAADGQHEESSAGAADLYYTWTADVGDYVRRVDLAVRQVGVGALQLFLEEADASRTPVLVDIVTSAVVGVTATWEPRSLDLVDPITRPLGLQMRDDRFYRLRVRSAASGDRASAGIVEIWHPTP
jgi:hypothetical protein